MKGRPLSGSMPVSSTRAMWGVAMLPAARASRWKRRTRLSLFATLSGRRTFTATRPPLFWSSAS